MRILRLTVTPELAGCSVGRLLRQEMHLSSSLLKSLQWRENAILLNGHPVTVRAAVKPGDIFDRRYLRCTARQRDHRSGELPPGHPVGG